MSLVELIATLLRGPSPEELERRELKRREIERRLYELRGRAGNQYHFVGRHKDDSHYVTPEGSIVVNVRKLVQRPDIKKTVERAY